MEKGLSVRSTECIPWERSSAAGRGVIKKEELGDSQVNNGG
jgi:hypothetical protein